MNRDTIKYIAMFTMLLNHIANVFLTDGELLSEFLKSIGYFTAPVMVYFLVEGFYYTRSRKNYLRRILVFAALSQFPYTYAFSPTGSLKFDSFNMMVTLSICFFILLILDSPMLQTRRQILILALFAASVWCDWSGLAPLMTYLFHQTRGNRDQLKRACGITLFVFFFYCYMSGVSDYSIPKNLLLSAIDCIGLILAFLVILYGYNGKRAKHGRTFSKWFFYLFYPAHLLILGLMSHHVL